MARIGWYYLHTNGELIYKRDFDNGQVADFRESDFVRAFWPLDPEDRETAWTILVEGLAAGASEKRVSELAEKWQCTDEDAVTYAEHIGVRLFKDGDHWCATREDFTNQMESPAGFGKTALEAFAELAKEVGYKPQKLWGNSFK